MKKIMYFIGGIFALVIALSLLGPLLGLLFSVFIVVASLHYYTKSTSTVGKVTCAILAMIGFLSAASNIPALIGLVAIVVFYFIIKNWKKEKAEMEAFEKNDPFTNFEKEWAKLSK